jgi:hypothetical protein
MSILHPLTRRTCLSLLVRTSWSLSFRRLIIVVGIGWEERAQGSARQWPFHCSVDSPPCNTHLSVLSDITKFLLECLTIRVFFLEPVLLFHRNWRGVDFTVCGAHVSWISILWFTCCFVIPYVIYGDILWDFETRILRAFQLVFQYFLPYYSFYPECHVMGFTN